MRVPRLPALLLAALAVLLVAPGPVSAAQSAGAAASARPASAGRDDYPYRDADGAGADRWGFTARQCVSFVAWRLAQRRSPLDNSSGLWGDAHRWDDTAREQRRTVSSRPVAGAVAHWDAYERSAVHTRGSAKANGTYTAGGAGHVGYVRRVHRDGSVDVEHYNMAGDGRYALTRLKAPRYLYLGVRSAR